jgi:hypothetical protein
VKRRCCPAQADLGAGITSLEGRWCWNALPGAMFVLAARVRVLVSDGGCLRVSLVCGPYVARAHGSGGRPRDRTNLGADLRRLHEW